MKRRKKEQTGGAAAAVQVRERGGHPFAALRGYMPLGGADAALYRSVREAVPIALAFAFRQSVLSRTQITARMKKPMHCI